MARDLAVFAHGTAAGPATNDRPSRDDERHYIIIDGAGFAEAVAEFEISLLENALTASRHVQKEAAERLGLGYHQFRRLLQKHHIS